MFWISAGVGIAILIMGLADYSRLVSHLRSSHETVWISLGRPLVIGDADSQRLALSFCLFLVSGRFLALKDKLVNKLCIRLIVLNVVLISCGAIMVVAGIRNGFFK